VRAEIFPPKKASRKAMKSRFSSGFSALFKAGCFLYLNQSMSKCQFFCRLSENLTQKLSGTHKNRPRISPVFCNFALSGMHLFIIALFIIERRF
jgi:hypothetical protein